MACRKLGIGAAAILIMAAAAAAEEKPAADLCVALLQAEYISPDSNTDGNELTGRLDTVLIEALSKQENITLVDRQLLDKVLAEKKLQKLDADTADEKLKPFIASGILICPTIVADSKSKQAVITIHAVLAQRGDLLAELVVKQDISGKASDALADIDKPLQQFLREMRQQTENRAGVPTFEVRHIAMAGKLSRIQWMADDLTDALAAEHYNGLVLLVPRQPVHTKEERLLRLMGLSRPDNGDASAKFSAASDYQISGEMSEETKQGISFEQTPVTILLRLTGGRRDISSTKLTGTVGDYSQLRTKALDWAAEALPKAGGVSPKTLDESHAKELAQTELETARRLAAIKYSGGAMERDRQERLALAALRAAHLDPTCEEASYLVVQSIDGLYDSRGQMRTLAYWDRLIQESQKYIDCFGDRIPQHHVQVLERMSHAGFRGNGLRQPTPRRT